VSSTTIEWTDATWNPVRGCVKVSPGCKHCYAETFAERWRGIPGHTYERGFDPRLVPEMLSAPLAWRKPRKVFVNSMSDLFGEFVPFEYTAAVFGVMAEASRHTFQVLTKRAFRMRAFFAWVASKTGGPYDPPPSFLVRTMATNLCVEDVDQGASDPWPLPNVHLGVSVEDRKYGAPRIDVLRRVPAAVRFLSIEPLLEDVGALDLTGIHQVIVGAESGHGARPMREDWVRSVRDQCIAQGVAFFYKQRLDGRGRKVSLPVLDGRQWAEFPATLPATEPTRG
jgi:protein gp37